MGGIGGLWLGIKCIVSVSGWLKGMLIPESRDTDTTSWQQRQSVSSEQFRADCDVFSLDRQSGRKVEERVSSAPFLCFSRWQDNFSYRFCPLSLLPSSFTLCKMDILVSLIYLFSEPTWCFWCLLCNDRMRHRLFTFLSLAHKMFFDPWRLFKGEAVKRKAEFLSKHPLWLISDLTWRRWMDREPKTRIRMVELRFHVDFYRSGPGGDVISPVYDIIWPKHVTPQLLHTNLT